MPAVRASVASPLAGSCPGLGHPASGLACLAGVCDLRGPGFAEPVLQCFVDVGSAGGDVAAVGSSWHGLSVVLVVVVGPVAVGVAGCVAEGDGDGDEEDGECG